MGIKTVIVVIFSIGAIAAFCFILQNARPAPQPVVVEASV